MAPNGGTSGRLFLLGGLFLSFACLLTYRLFAIQITEHKRWSGLATAEHRETKKIEPRRGSLVDTNGFALAVSVPLDAVEVTGTQVGKRAEPTAQALASLLNMPIGEVLAKIDPAKPGPVIVKDGLSASASERVVAAQLPGVRVVSIPVRQYPEGSIAAQLLGFVGRDRQGLTGLEYQFDEELAGTSSTIETEKDIDGQELALALRVVTPGRSSADVVLTLDRYVQRTAERELAEAIRVNKAAGGMIVVMEPATGAVVAMASAPTYTLSDRMEFSKDDEPLYKATPVTNQYEPGSVMKLVTMAAGLDLGVVTPTTTVYDGGVLQIGTDKIFNWDKNGNGAITMTDVLVRSSNIGASYVASRLGRDRFFQYVRAFGFGQKTGVQLPGEVSGMLRSPDDPKWSPVDLATNSFGQGMAVTPLQMLSAICAIGNDGVLMRPTIVKERIVDGVAVPVEPAVARRVISAVAAKTLRDMMVTVFEQPALSRSRIPGYRIGVKTGTADIPTNLGYKSGKTFASIVSLLPADHARLAVLIRIDSPEAIYGGAVAAPILKRLGLELLAYYRVPPSAVAGPSGR